jgi:hypothetical protein
MSTQDHDGHREGGEVDVQSVAEAEVEEEQEDEKRDPAEEPDVQGNQGPQPAGAVYLATARGTARQNPNPMAPRTTTRVTMDPSSR